MDYPRSHTDPLANLVVISALEIERHFQEIVERDFPIGTLPAFLHEICHHWSFNTPLGATLQLLFLRARRSAVMHHYKPDTAPDGYDLLNDVVRYEAALAMTRPLSEGIALFAEYDAIPGNAETISTPMQLAAAFYARGLSVRDPANPYHGLDLVLAAGRVSLPSVRRKADLLIQPLTCDDGGYLPGYLLVKGLWWAACHNSVKFVDTDFFLQYLHHCIFNDWGLVARLLEESVRDIGVLDLISERLNARLRDFVQAGTTHERAVEFESVMKAGKMRVIEVRTPVVHSDLRYTDWGEDEEAALGRKRFKDGMERHFDAWPEDRLLHGLMTHDAHNLAARSIVTLGHAALQAREREGNIELYSEELRVFGISKERIERVLPAKTTMEVDVIATDQPGGLFVILSHDSAIVSCVSLGKSELPPNVRESITTRGSRKADAVLWDSVIGSALAARDVADILDIVRAGIIRSLNEQLVPASLVHVPVADLASVIKLMRDDGLLPLLEGSVGLVLDAAAASLCLPTEFNLGAVDTFHSWSRGSANASLEAINALLEPRLGIAPFRLDDGAILPMSLI